MSSNDKVAATWSGPDGHPGFVIDLPEYMNGLPDGRKVIDGNGHVWCATNVQTPTGRMWTTEQGSSLSTQGVLNCPPVRALWQVADDPIEPISVPDLHELIRDTCEALDTLVDHAHALKHEHAARLDHAPIADANGSDLAFVADRLRAAWAACRVAQTAAQDLAAVLP